MGPHGPSFSMEVGVGDPRTADAVAGLANVRDMGRHLTGSDDVTKESAMTLKLGVLALVEAKPGNEQAVWDFLNGGLDIVATEPATKTWYAFRVNDNTFGIFDTFETEEGRQAHLNGAIPAALAEHDPRLLAKDPDIRPIELIAVK